MAELFTNSGDPGQTLHSACLSITVLGVFRLKWVNFTSNSFFRCKFQHLVFYRASKSVWCAHTVSLSKDLLTVYITEWCSFRIETVRIKRDCEEL